MAVSSQHILVPAECARRLSRHSDGALPQGEAAEQPKPILFHKGHSRPMEHSTRQGQSGPHQSIQALTSCRPPLPQDEGQPRPTPEATRCRLRSNTHPLDGGLPWLMPSQSSHCQTSFRTLRGHSSLDLPWQFVHFKQSTCCAIRATTARLGLMACQRTPGAGSLTHHSSRLS